jgi:hypothetical protein
LLRRTSWLVRALLGLAAAVSFEFVVTMQFYYLLAGLALFTIVIIKQGGMAAVGFGKEDAPIVRN